MAPILPVLPLNYENNPIYNSNDVGRATRGSALSFPARLCLRRHHWQNAADYCKQVMDLNIYSLYPSYLGLLTEANKWCSENIFSVLSDANVNGPELLNYFGPFNHPLVQNRWQYYAVTWEFFYEGKRRGDLIRRNKYFPCPQNQVNLNPNLDGIDTGPGCL